MTEQPALTPEQLDLIREVHPPSLRAKLRRELAREREARAMDATDAERELDEALDARIQAERFAQELEGRVRELQEALRPFQHNPDGWDSLHGDDPATCAHCAAWRVLHAEVLVGLPERDTA